MTAMLIISRNGGLVAKTRSWLTGQKRPAAGAATIKELFWTVKIVADLKHGGSRLFHASKIS